MNTLPTLLATLVLTTITAMAADPIKALENAAAAPAALTENKAAVLPLTKPNPAEAFKKIDANHDGTLSIDEFKASPMALKDPVKTEELFKKKDKDGNGKLSLEEVSMETKPEDKGVKPADKAPADKTPAVK
jgi:hypothetical protein